MTRKHLDFLVVGQIYLNKCLLGTNMVSVGTE